jgi:2-polyprenyl-3-methyl-5-hydroxy-6-metoxy-1,4-benzoquinol methylase
MTTLAVRSRREEQMDSAELDAETYARVLRDLARVNRWTFAARPTLGFLASMTRGRRKFRLLDVGFGYGDMLRTIRSWAAERGLNADLVGIDRDPRSAAVAAAATPASAHIEYMTGDYADAGGPFDFIVSSLVAHHMTTGELCRFIRFMDHRAGTGWQINDLHRHRAAMTLFPLLALALGVNPIVRDDGMLSIARSFREPEWRSILDRAGIGSDTARVVRYFPFRLCVERRF